MYEDVANTTEVGLIPSGGHSLSLSLRLSLILSLTLVPARSLTLPSLIPLTGQSSGQQVAGPHSSQSVHSGVGDNLNTFQ